MLSDHICVSSTFDQRIKSLTFDLRMLLPHSFSVFALTSFLCPHSDIFSLSSFCTSNLSGHESHVYTPRWKLLMLEKQCSELLLPFASIGKSLPVGPPADRPRPDNGPPDFSDLTTSTSDFLEVAKPIAIGVLGSSL